MTAKFPRRWRLTGAALWRLLLAISLLLVTYTLSHGQPPTPLPPESDVADEGAAEPVVERSETAAIVIESIEAAQPQTPSELLRAVQALQRLEEYEEAKSYLERITQQNLDTGQLADLYVEFGAGVMLQLSRDDGLAPEGRAVVMSILQAARQQQRDPARLQSLVAELADSSLAIRSEARVGIAKAGADAVPVLLDALRQPPAGVSAAELRQALVRVGRRAEGPLIAALGGSDPALQTEAARALGYCGSKQSVAHLLRPYLIGDPNLRQAAAASLRRLGSSLPRSAMEANTLLRDHVLRHLGDETARTTDLEQDVQLWTWNAERKNVVRTEVAVHIVGALRAARLARDMVELDPSTENTKLLLASRLEVDQWVGGIDQPLPKGAGSAYRLASAVGLTVVADVLASSVAAGWDGAAIGAAELLGDFGDGQLLLGDGWSPLVLALHSPSRRVRYAAARAIMNIDPRQPYPGASYLPEVLAELAAVSGRERVLIGMPRQDVASLLAGRLSGLGFRTQRTVDGKDFLRAAVDSSDFDVMILSDAVNCPPASETLQQLRKDPQGQAIPVILAARTGSVAAAERLASRDDLVVVMPEFADDLTLSTAIGQAEKLASRRSVPAARRLEQAVDAMQWLTHLTRYSQSYAWYDLSRVRSMAESALATGDLADEAVDLLGYLGTESSQKTLVDLASQNGLPMQRRLRAANAFTEAVLRRGLMLHQADIDRQYDRYNASADADQATQEILGQLLDAIETP